MGQVIFFVLGATAVAAGVGVIAQRSAVRSALFLLVSFCCLAGLYLLLNAQLVAVAQIIIYAGAIVVLFLFVIMLLGLERAEETPDFRRYHTIAGALLAALLLAGIVWAVMASAGGLASAPGAGTAVPPASPPVGDANSIGAALLTDMALPFEMVGVLLLVAIIGSVALAKKR